MLAVRGSSAIARVDCRLRSSGAARTAEPPGQVAPAYIVALDHALVRLRCGGFGTDDRCDNARRRARADDAIGRGASGVLADGRPCLERGPCTAARPATSSAPPSRNSSEQRAHQDRGRIAAKPRLYSPHVPFAGLVLELKHRPCLPCGGRAQSGGTRALRRREDRRSRTACVRLRPT
jgi:hypothetical protein